MDFITVLQIIRRRWILFGGAMLVTVATAAILSTLDLNTYAAEGTVVIVRGPGAAADDAVEGADPALQQTARILVEVAAAESVTDAGGEVAITVDENLPIMRVTATNEVAAAALDAATAAADLLRSRLEELQASPDVFVPEETVMRQLVAPTDPSAATGDDGVPQFSSSATLLLTRAEQGPGDETGASGIIDPDNSENFVAGVIAERFTDDAIEQEMLDEGATGEITLEFDELNPIIRILAESDNRQEALVTGQVAVDTMQRIAEQIQTADDIPMDLRFRVEALSYPLEAEVFESARLRTVLAVVALGLLASIGLALMVDAAHGRRSPREDRTAPRGDDRRRGSAAAQGSWWLDSGPDGPEFPDDEPDRFRTRSPPDR